MKRFLSIFLVYSMALACCCAASHPTTVPKAKAEAFFQTVMKGKSDKAFDTLFEGSPFSGSKSEDLQRMRDDFRRRVETNDVLGYENVLEQSFGRSVVKLSYILKLENLPLVWEFYFYKPKDTWVLARVGFDEDLRKLAESH